MAGAGRLDVRRWLSAARHPARRDGLIATALLVLPWVLAALFAPRHYLNVTVVAILAAVSIPLSTLWLTWAAFRNASRPAPADSADTPGTTSKPRPAAADAGGTDSGLGLPQRHREITGKPVRLLPRPGYLAGREELLADLGTRLTAGGSPR